jgi:hypothetical protein
MPARCPLQAMLGQAPERLKNDSEAASAGRRMLGRRGIDSDAEAALLARVPKLRMLPLTNGTDCGLTEKVQGHRVVSTLKPEIMLARCPLQTVLGPARGVANGECCPLDGPRRQPDKPHREELAKRESIVAAARDRVAVGLRIVSRDGGWRYSTRWL